MGSTTGWLDAILNSATEDAIVALDLGGKVTQWNTGAERITGYAAAEMLDRSAELVFTPEDRAAGVFGGELDLALHRGRAPNERWHVRKDGTRFWASGAMLPLLGSDGRAQGYVNTFRDGTEARAETDRRDLLLGEMGHRIRNLLTIVRAIAAQTARHARPEDFMPAFDARLAALARSQDVLDGSGGCRCLHGLLERTLAFLGADADRFALDGPSVPVPADTVLMLSLAVHELATNAVKHGALSVPEGRVVLGWRTAEETDGTEITWREEGGPPVQPPDRVGFGSQLLRRGLGGQPGTAVALHYAADGLLCRIRIPSAPAAAGRAGPADQRPGAEPARRRHYKGMTRAQRNIAWYDRLQADLEACRESALAAGDRVRAKRALLLRVWANDRAEFLGLQRG